MKNINVSLCLSLSLAHLLFNRALWFVLEILMAKNENNSHAFIRKMVENIKQTKDGQTPDDAKINEVCLSLTSSIYLFYAVVLLL